MAVASDGFGESKKSGLPLFVSILVVTGFFATTLPQPQVLGRLPLQNLLKTQLHVGPDGMATFFFLVGFPWYLKPLAGIITDAFPLFRSKRRWYLILSCLLASCSWILMGLVPHTYNTLLYSGMIVNTFMVIASTVFGAFMVEAGRDYAATGRITAIRQFTQNVCTLLNGPISGFLASGAFAVASGSAALLAATVIPFVWYLLREKTPAGLDLNRFHVAGQQLRTIVSSKTLWAAAGFMFLLYVAPGFGTPLYFIQTNKLGFSQQMIGDIGLFAGAAGIASSVLYGFICKRWTLRPLLYLAMGTAVISPLFYLFYKSYPIALCIESQGAFFGILAELAIMDLALRATPKGCEGFGFSLLMSVRNLAIFGTDKLGSFLYEKKHVPFEHLVFYNSGTTLIVFLLVPLLPAVLMIHRDAEARKQNAVPNGETDEEVLLENPSLPEAD